MFRGTLARPDARTADRARAWSDSLLVDHAVFRVLWDNWAEVVPGRLYRSNHPTPSRLAAAMRRHGLRTVLNLRGHRQWRIGCTVPRGPPSGLAWSISTRRSKAAAPRIATASCGWRRIFRTMQEPVLMHCKSGADRAGLGAGLYLMLNGGTTREALAQLSWRFGHFSRSPHRYLGCVLHPLCDGSRGPQAFPRLGARRLRRDGAAAGFCGRRPVELHH